MNNTKNNILIAKFMGAYESDFDEFGIGWCFPKKEPYMPRQAPSLNELKFHSSWDWLMPVIDKIENGLEDCLGYVAIEKYNIESYSPGSLKRRLVFFHYKENGKRFIGQEKLNAVYRSVIEFIKWYNNNK